MGKERESVNVTNYKPPLLTSDHVDSDNNIKDINEQVRFLNESRKAMLGRRRFGVRWQVYIAYTLVFIFAVMITIALISNIYEVNERIKFLEFVNDFTSEIQEARRYEKNFFLYQTNLEDAITNIRLAKTTFILKADQFSTIMRPALQRGLLSTIENYEKLLNRLIKLKHLNSPNLADATYMERIEDELRQNGKEILRNAQRLNKLKMDILSSTLSWSRDIHIYSLVVLLIFLGANAYVLVSRICGPLKRFSEYAQRIAGGYFSPITPKRPFRDEFTDLAVAFNEMIKEIDQREAVLIQTHKMRAVGTLTAGIAHELNNPLNNVMLTVHMLIEDYNELTDEERLDMLKDIAGENNRSKKIIRNLLDFVRESQSTIETLDINKLLQSTIELVKNQIRFSGIKLHLQVADNLPLIHGDGQKLQQVFLNLILNAVDASEKGQDVRIESLLGPKRQYVIIKIVDYGSGIPKHILASIFDPFFTTKPKGKGTGLGLSVSQGIVAKHGGQLQVSSEEGQGAAFNILLPVTTIEQETITTSNLM